MSSYYFVLHLMLWVDFLPILFFLVFFSLTSVFKLYKAHFFFILFSFLAQCGSYFLTTNGISSLPFLNYYNLIEFALLFIIFRAQNRGFHNVFSISLVVFVIVYILDFNQNGLMQYTLILSTFIYILWTLLTYVNKINSFAVTHNGNSFDKYFNVGILFYYSCSLIFFSIFNSLNQTNFNIWTAHNIVEIITKLVFTLAVCKIPLKSTQLD